MNQAQIACETQSAILAVFKEHFKDMLGEDSGNHIYATKADSVVCENVIPAEDDAGEWAPNAHAIIYHVNGMPSIDNIEKWGKVSDMLESDKHWLYVEAINPEVSAVFSL
tara:strand:- start:971 stop:1300 length:330 start_codon:yes stop_codon:yes gene_type:complete